MGALLQPLNTFFRRRKRDGLLRHAAVWPTVTAQLLKSTVEEKDPLAEGGTAFQDRQVESAFYFTLEGAYYGGHVRTVPLSDSEAHRALRQLPEDTPVHIRYNPQNPDETVALPTDNPTFPIPIWPV
jgi:hypothetical protein